MKIRVNMGTGARMHAVFQMSAISSDDFTNLVPRIFLWDDRRRDPGNEVVILLVSCNLVPRACDPWEGNEGSGIIRIREST